MSKITLTNRVCLISALLWLTIGTAEAEFIGLNLGASHWQSATSSSFEANDTDSIDLIDDLDVDNPEQSSMTFILEHPITALPNIRYQGSQLDSNTSLRGETFSSEGQASSAFDLSHDDIVLYYQLLDNWVDLDLGVDVKRLDGEVSFAGANSSAVSVARYLSMKRYRCCICLHASTCRWMAFILVPTSMLMLSIWVSARAARRIPPS
jgi:outer membrane protein